MHALTPDDMTIMIVNYNTGPLALDAAFSAIGAGARRAIIVDNASTDGSLSFFEAVSAGQEKGLSQIPPAPLREAPVKFENAAQLQILKPSGGAPAALAPIIVLRSPDNRGFAAGCNQALRFWMAHAQSAAGLLLNPDALVSQGALHAFCARLADDAAGLCGASVVGFEAPHRVQAAGGAHLTSVFHQGRNIGDGLSLDALPDQGTVEAALSYPLGAAIAFRTEYPLTAGLLDERYFLYYEEADWTLAGAAASSGRLSPVWARDAIIYHRYGAASGSERRAAGVPSARSALSDFHMARSRLLFAEKWRPISVPVNRAAIGAQAAMRLWRGRGDNAAAVWRALSA